jgi:hypothetical protein
MWREICRIAEVGECSVGGCRRKGAVGSCGKLGQQDESAHARNRSMTFFLFFFEWKGDGFRCDISTVSIGCSRISTYIIYLDLLTIQ